MRASDRAQPRPAATTTRVRARTSRAKATVAREHQPRSPAARRSRVRIPAPADAQSVVVVFPSADEVAAWETTRTPGRRRRCGWRGFLVGRAHGRTALREHGADHASRRPRRDHEVCRSGRTQRNLDVRCARREPATRLKAKQKLTAGGDLTRRRRRGRTSRRSAALPSVLTDASASSRAPDGELLTFTHVGLGEFVGRGPVGRRPRTGSCGSSRWIGR